MGAGLVLGALRSVLVGRTGVTGVVHATGGVKSPQLLDECEKFACVTKVKVADFFVDEKAEAAAEATKEFDVRSMGRLFVDSTRVVLGEVVHDVEETVDVFIQRVLGRCAVLVLEGAQFGTESLRRWDAVPHVDAGVVESRWGGESFSRRLVEEFGGGPVQSCGEVTKIRVGHVDL